MNISVLVEGGGGERRIVLENVSADMAMESNLITSLHEEWQLVI